MSKTTEIELKKNKIVVSHKSIIKNQIVHLEFIPINKYQLCLLYTSDAADEL